MEEIRQVFCGDHKALRNSGIGGKLVAEYGILPILRRNDGILHYCRERIFSKMIYWIRNFGGFYEFAKFSTCYLAKRKRALLAFSSQQHHSFVLRGRGILVKYHRNVGLRLKIACNGGFLPALMTSTFSLFYYESLLSKVYRRDTRDFLS